MTINVDHLVHHAAAFAQRGHGAINVVHKAWDDKHKKHAEEPEAEQAEATEPAHPGGIPFSSHWTQDERFNPLGHSEEDAVHPDPVNARRMKEFNAAAQRLADWADSRVDEMRNSGK